MSMFKVVPKASAFYKQNGVSQLICLQQQIFFKKSVNTTCRNYKSPIADPANTGENQTGINFETLGSWNNRIEQNINVEHSIRSGKLVPEISLESLGQATLLGRRKKNEDRTVAKQIDNNVTLFAIYDGHGGETAVNYISHCMSEYVGMWLDKGEKHLGNVLRYAFRDVNEAFINFIQEHYHGRSNYFLSGTTATVCLLRHGVQLVVGHVGDSQALVCREGQSKLLTAPHRPVDKEKDRIISSGGFITHDSLGNPRVNGKLEMSRSLGDAEMKPYGVICDPDIKSLNIKHGIDAFLLLTTDGVHYVLNDQEIVDITARCETPDEAARFLTDQAMHYGSEDNATALVVPLGAWGKYSSSKTLMFSFSRNVVSKRYY